MLSYSGGQLAQDTDACNIQVFCVLLQEQSNDTTKPIGYWSCSPTNTKQWYDSTQRKCLVVVWSVFLLRPSLKQTSFTIRTDHDALKCNLIPTDFTGRITRWRLRLSEPDFDVVHRAGVDHQVANALSRLNSSSKDKSPSEDYLPLYTIAKYDNPLVLVHTVGLGEICAQSVPNTRPSGDETK